MPQDRELYYIKNVEMTYTDRTHESIIVKVRTGAKDWKKII